MKEKKMLVSGSISRSSILINNLECKHENENFKGTKEKQKDKRKKYR